MLETPLKALAEKVGLQLKANAFYLATAESCTGGGVSFWLTMIPGSSQWFDRGFVTYSDSAKEQMLGVNPLILRQQGAVSEAVAKEMAEGALTNSKAQVSIATTGIAGPQGGTEKDPVGTVWLAWASKHFVTVCETHCFSGTRDEVREKTIQVALEKLLILMQHKKT